MSNDFFYKLTASILVFLNIFFLSAIIFSQVVLKAETVIVPNVSGKTVAEARADLARKDLQLAHLGTEFNDDFEKGLIFAQDPAPGSRIRVTTVVKVISSAGSQSVKVPDFRGKSLESVVSLLRDTGLARGYISQIHHSGYAAGRVISQRPAPESVVERNSPVHLLISQGGEEVRYVMPDLIGKRLDKVIAQLKIRNFQVADIQRVYYPGLPSGVIVRQDPPLGHRVQKRSRIALEVSR